MEAESSPASAVAGIRHFGSRRGDETEAKVLDDATLLGANLTCISLRTSTCKTILGLFIYFVMFKPQASTYFCRILYHRIKVIKL